MAQFIEDAPQIGTFIRQFGLKTRQAVDFSSASSVALPAGTTVGGSGVLSSTITSSSANALTVGPNGTTNPTLNVDASTASAATGINIKSAAAAGGVAISTLSSGTNESLTIDAKGTGTVTINGTATGIVILPAGSTIGGSTVLTSTITSSSATAFQVGPNGATNPTFVIDASTASAATGIKVKSAAAAGGIAISTVSSGTNENLTIDAKGTGTVTINGTASGIVILPAGTTVGGSAVLTSTITSSSATAFQVGPNGATNPTFVIDASTASAATGIKIKSAAAAGGVAVSVLSSGANDNLTVDAKGTGTIGINTTSTTSGLVTIGNSTSVAGAQVNGLTNVTSVSANALTVGANGATNPVFNVDASTASVATGVKIKGAAAGSDVTISTVSSGTNDGFVFNSKGTGRFRITPGADSANAFVVTNAANTAAHLYVDSSTPKAGSNGASFQVNNVLSNGFAVGAAGGVNPSFNVDNSTASQVAGLNLKGAATGGTVALSAIDSGANTNITVDGKGTGTIGINTTSTTSGLVTIGNSTSVAGALVNGTIQTKSATLLQTTLALTNNAAAQVATITNGPTAGNPTKWIPINDNGTTRNIPVW